jgi:uncharacterized membrane protein YgaE (UPF0421/DUF939 family)
MNILFLLKTGVGSAVAIILAESFGLLYSPSAGIITLLTIQNTKKETILIALKRFGSFLVAVVLAFFIFQLFGYSAIAFGCFVILFVAICIWFDLRDGISMNAVLMTHFLIERRMDVNLLVNEISLLLIGMGIGILLNLIMPRYLEQIKLDQYTLEEEMKVALRSLAGMLKDKTSCLIQRNDMGLQTSEENDDLRRFEKANEQQMMRYEASNKGVNYTNLELLLDRLLKKAYEDAGNTLLNNTKYLVSYLEMRKLQVGVLKEISKNIEHIPVLLHQSYPIADFLEQIAVSFHELNNVKSLLEDLQALNQYYRKDELPRTREEFEYRAVLFQILKELEYFLMLKRNFVVELDVKHMKSFWEKEDEMK